jgi:hypothetical protein
VSKSAYAVFTVRITASNAVEDDPKFDDQCDCLRDELETVAKNMLSGFPGVEIEVNG